MVQAGAAGHDLHALAFQQLQIRQRRRTLNRKLCPAVVQQNGVRQNVLLGEGVDEGLHQSLAQNRVTAAHFIAGQYHHGALGTGVRDAGGGLFFCGSLHGGQALFGEGQHHLIMIGCQSVAFGRQLFLTGHLQKILHRDGVIHRHGHGVARGHLGQDLFGFHNGDGARLAHGVYLILHV